MIAFTRERRRRRSIDVSLLTSRASPIDIDVARTSMTLYEGALRDAGVDVRRLPPRDDLPDSVFVEDTAVVLDEVAVVTRPGASCRRDETESVRERARANVRTIATIEGPATLDGGDVLVLDREVLVGLTPRTNLSGMQQLRSLLAPFGYEVRAVPVRGCLHLKSAITRAGTRTLVVNPSWIDPRAGAGLGDRARRRARAVRRQRALVRRDDHCVRGVRAHERGARPCDRQQRWSRCRRANWRRPRAG